MDKTANLLRVQPIRSPDGSNSPTRWQQLCTVAQTKSLIPSDPAVIAALAGRHAAHNSALNHFATVTKPRQGLCRLLHGVAGSDRALLFEPEVEPSPCDSLETDIRVDAVLRKAAARAARLAGLPQAPTSHIKVPPGLLGLSGAQPATAQQLQVINMPD